jgi:hypothetical protein
MHTFIRNALHWAAGLASTLVVGPLAAFLLSRVVDERGDHVVSLLGSDKPLLAIAGVLVLLLAALVMGRVGRALGGVSLGLLCAGLVLGWGAFSLGNIEQAVRATQQGAFFPLLAAEGLVLTLLCAGIVLHIAAPGMQREGSARTSGTGVTSSGGPWTKRVLPLFIDIRRGSSAAVLLQCVVVSAVVGGAVAALCATHVGRGQSVFAGFCGALLAGVAAQITASAAQARISPAVPALGLALAALAGPIFAIAMHGNTLVPDTLSGGLVWIARLLPLDWAVGAVLGAHVGMGWAGASIAQASDHATDPRDAARA